MAVKTGKPDRKRTQRDSTAPRKTSRPPGMASRPPGGTSRPPSTSTRPPATNSPSASRSSRPRPPRPDGHRSDPSRHEASQPEITLKRSVAGRETLSAISEELARDLPQKHRPKLDTLSYEDRPASPSRPAQGSSPEVITIGEAPIGRATLAAIDEALASEARTMMAASERLAAEARHGASSAAPRAAPAPAVIFEISTFIVEGDEIFSKASEKARRDFVEHRLLHRLPALSMDEVVRIEFSRGAAPNTVILRVWSKVGQPPG